MVGVDGVDRVNGVFLKISQVFMETTAAVMVEVAVVTDAVVVMEIRGGPSIRDVDNVVGTALPP